MNITKFTPLIILLIPYVLFSQSSLTGSIENRDKEPVAFANVILLNAKDSTTVYKGTISEEDGSFLFEGVKDDNYLLKVSFVGFTDELKTIRVKGDTELKRITLQEASDALDEVVVNARRPKISRQVDRLVFDVENSTLSTGNTFEILKRTPGVIVSQGNLLIKNRPATVYINDRKVYLNAQELQQLLEGFSAGNVKSVEVITNPPAKYDAEGGAILNIVTSKNISIGYKGSLNASNTIAIVPKNNIGMSHYYKTDWLNVYASYNYNDRNLYKRDENFVEFYEPNGTTDSRWFTDFSRRTDNISHSVNTILDFTLSEKSSLNLSANLLFTPNNDSDLRGNTEIYDASNSLDSLIFTRSDLKNETENILLSSAYNTSLGESTKLAVIGNYINYDDRQFQEMETTYSSEDLSISDFSYFSTNAKQKSEIFTGQVDIESVLGSSNFETGVKYSGLRSDSGQRFLENGAEVLTGALADNLNYDEDIYAAYASISKDWDKFSLKAGLRGEYTDVQGLSESFGQVNSQEYFELFPTVYFTYSPSENHYFSADYSRRITRPRFESLNTYRYFISENNFQDGNPDLMPSIANTIKFSYSYKNKLFFDLYWDKIDNAIGTLPFQDNANETLRSASLNMDFQQQFSFDVGYYAYLKDWWAFSSYSSFFYMQNDFPALESGGQIVTKDVFSAYFYLANNFTLSKDRTFTGDLSATYVPNFITGSYEFEEAQFGLNLGLRKTFFDSRLVATVNVEDIFNEMNIPLRSQYLNQNNGYFAKPESRMVKFGLIYKFGNFKLSDNKRAIDAEESERLKSQN